MKYVKLENGTATNVHEIRKSHPNMSIPENADLTDLGYATLHDGEIPIAPEGKVVVESSPVQRDGKWYTAYSFQDVPETQPYVPYSISMGQARLALFDMGKLAEVDALINSLPEAEKQRAKIEWEFRPTVERNSPLVLQIGAALGLDLDAMFIAANKL